MPSGHHNSSRANKRTKQQKEMDRIEIVRLLRRGWGYRRIAEHFRHQDGRLDGGICHTQVAADYHQVLKEMSDDYRANKKHMRILKLQELEELKEQAREAWDYANGRFLESVIEQVLKHVDDAKEAGLPSIPSEFKIGIRGLPPNDYLLTILKALGLEMDIHGLKAPKKKDVTKRVFKFNWDLLAKAAPEHVVDEIEARINEVLPKPPHNISQLPEPTTNGENGTKNGE